MAAKVTVSSRSQEQSPGTLGAMAQPVPAAACPAPAEHRGPRHCKHGMAARKADHSKGKTFHQALLFPHERVRGIGSPHCVPQAHQRGADRHTADCHSAALGSHCRAKEEALLWVHGAHPPDTAGHQGVLSSESSSRPQLPGLEFLCSQRRNQRCTLSLTFSNAASA